MGAEQHYTCVGAFPLKKVRPCFALPIFKNSSVENGPYFAQVISSLDGKIRGFSKVSLMGERIIRFSRENKFTQGSVAIYGFINGNNELLLLGKDQLAERKEELLDGLIGQHSTKLQIFELAGDDNSSAKYIAGVTHDLLENIGIDTARNFINSSVRSDAWEMLIEKSENVDEEKTISANLSSLDFFLDESGQINFKNLGTEFELRQSLIDLVKGALIAKYAKVVNDQLLRKTNELKYDEYSFSFSDVGKIFQILQYFSRQEERLAFLIVCAFKYPRFAQEFTNVADRAQSASMGIACLRRLVLGNEWFENSGREMFYELIIKIMRMWKTGDRDRFLSYLFKWMAADEDLYDFLVPAGDSKGYNFFSFRLSNKNLKDEIANELVSVSTIIGESSNIAFARLFDVESKFDELIYGWRDEKRFLKLD